MLPKQVVCYYADIGRPYLPLIQDMNRTCKAVMPGVERVLLTPTPSAELAKAGFTTIVELKVDVTEKTICYEKVRAIITWQRQATAPIAFVDPDLLFQRPIQIPDDADVGLLWRKKICEPINTGMILAKPGNHEFWQHYGNATATLPRQLYGWFCDQLAFSVMFGSMHQPGDIVEFKGAKVKFIPVEEACAQPELCTPETWAIHYKGLRKGGDEWTKYFSPRPLRAVEAA